MDLDTSEEVRPDTLWRIYSMTKPITSVAAMMLWEEGKLELTDEISRFAARVWRDPGLRQGHDLDAVHGADD